MLVSGTRAGAVLQGVRRQLAAFATVIVACVLAGCSAPAAFAQDAWWEGIRGSGASDFSNGRRADRPAERTVEPLEDLRTGSVPWRSDVMLSAVSAAVQRYEQIVAKGGWPTVPPGRMMRVNEDDERVPVLRQRLRISGDLPAKTSYYSAQTFDSELEEAVKRFQRRHGLRPTGRIERSVYAHLNVTAAERLDQLRLNLDRLTQLATNVEERYVFVNVPAFQLEAVEQFEVQQRHRVIVGRPGRDTPDISTTIRAMNFFPQWRVPDSVARLDLIPRLQTEPEYLENEGIRVYDGFNGPELDRSMIDWRSPDVVRYKFRQDAGEKNALGLVRLDMSNEHNVYMHDTPMKTLFDQRSRPFSAGCVRVQGVFDLVEWLARGEMGWEQPGQVKAVLESGMPLDVNLTRPVPVIFGYITAWAEPSTGRVEFRPDIYGRDSPAMGQQIIADDDAPPAAAAAALAP